MMKFAPALILAATAGTAIAAAPESTDTCETTCETSCLLSNASDAMARAAAYRMIEAQTFNSLPAEHQEIIAEKLKAMGEEIPGAAEQIDEVFYAEHNKPLTAEELEAAWEHAKEFTTREAFEGFNPIHQRQLANYVRMAEDTGIFAAPCFAPGTDPSLVEAFDAVVQNYVPDNLPDGFDFFQQTGRWGSTARNPGGSNAQGTPTILTYSFPDDGVTVPSGVGEPQGPNALNAFLDGIYGNRATWRAIYDDIFARWGELSGVTYVLEPNDDNMTLFNFPGVDGVRGDLRMAGKPIDGNSGTLAYNFFPQNGDMVLDTADNFYNNLASNSQRLRNILWHEHGHGMGQLHVCPVEGTKLMEPFINLSFTGPQLDDILNAQRHYGDNMEPNDSQASANNIGAFNAGTFTQVDEVSLDDELDVDFYTVTVNELTEIRTTLRPVGFNYLNGPQTGNCNTGSNYNPGQFQNLAIAILDASGSVLGSADNNGSGANETLNVSVLPGDYTIRITGSQPNTDQIQAYELDLFFDLASGIPPQFVSPNLPSEAMPGQSAAFAVEVNPGTDSIISGPFLNYRANGDASFTQVPLTPAAGDLFTGAFPGFNCDEDPEFFLSVVGDDSGEVRFPESGNLTLVITDGDVVAFADDAETNPGWVVSGNITADTAGRWERGFPQGNDRGDPAADADGSGQAWLTGINADSNSDVDNGETILTSPAFETNNASTINFSYWFNDIAGGPVNGDSYIVSVSSDNGATYNVVRTYTTAQGAWRSEQLLAGSDFTPSAQTRLRLTVNDLGVQNVIEGGFDNLVVSSRVCTPIDEPCLADVNQDGDLNGLDFGAWLNAFNAMSPLADQNQDGSINGLDFGAWLSNFNAGCD